MVVSTMLIILCQVLLLSITAGQASASKSVHYIKPTSYTPCPNEPCLTLSEFTLQVSGSLDPEAALIFLPGDHSAPYPLTIGNATSFSMHGDFTATIYCLNSAFFHFSNVSEVEISGLNLAYCGSATEEIAGVHTEHITQLKIVNTSFHSGNTTAVFASNVLELYIASCSFIDNVSITGAGLAVFNSTGNISDTKFVNNTAYNGGGIFASSSSILYLSGHNAFWHNRALEFGGGISAENDSGIHIDGITEILGNKAGSFGGGIVIYQSTIISEGSVIFDTNEVTGSGGAVFAGEAVVLLSGNTTYIHNHARGEGGGVFTYASQIILDGYTEFINNTVYYYTGENASGFNSGGGIAAMFGSSLILNGSTVFKGNWAGQHGGGVSVIDADAYFVGGEQTFRDNFAQFGGGGVFLLFATLHSNTVTVFERNWALNGSGGGLSASYSMVLFTKYTRFLQNQVHYRSGGGVNAEDSDVLFNGYTLFVNNTAHVSGGAISLLNCDRVVIAGISIFDQNSASSGGAVYSYESSTHFIGAHKITSNRAAVSRGDTFGGGLYVNQSIITSSNETTLILYGNTAVSETPFVDINPSTGDTDYVLVVGGAMFATESTILFEGNTLVISNGAHLGGGLFLFYCTAALGTDGANSYLTVIGNVAKKGGGVYISNSEVQLIASTHVSMNIAVEDGGGMVVVGSELSFQGRETLILDNIAKYGGGAFLLWDISETLVLFNGTNLLANNTAMSSGGAIWMGDSTCVFAGTIEFVNNSAASYGGAIFMDTEELLLTESRSAVSMSGTIRFTNNQAGQSGGAVSLISGSLNCTGHTLFKGNEAFNGGGIVTWNSKSYPLENVIAFIGETFFENNSAEKSGGAIMCNDCDLASIGNTVFIDNLANGGNGGAFELYTLFSRSTASFRGTSFFLRNCASFGHGGALNVYNSTLSMIGKTTFRENSAPTASALYAFFHSNVALSGTVVVVDNIASSESTVAAEGFSSLTFVGSTVLRGSSGSGISLYAAELSLKGTSLFTSISSRLIGIYASRSNVSSIGKASFNMPDGGTGLIAVYSSVDFDGNTLFVECRHHALMIADVTLRLSGMTIFRDNTASTVGGGIFALRSDVSLYGETAFTGNTAEDSGGGMYAALSVVRMLGSKVVFLNNIAGYGGGLALAYSSNLYTLYDTSVYFIENKAVKGAGIHVSDIVSRSACSREGEDLHNTGECFINVIVPEIVTWSQSHIQVTHVPSNWTDLFLSIQPNFNFVFHNNFADLGGSILYGVTP